MTIAVLALGFFALVLAISAVRDLTQREHAVIRNFPVIGHFRYWCARHAIVNTRSTPS